MSSSCGGGGSPRIAPRRGRVFRRVAALASLGLGLLGLLAGTGACSAIIAGELGDKPGSGGSTSHPGTGGAHVDGGTGGGKHGCTADGDCASAADPVCDVDAGVCVPCTPSDDACPAGQHCTPANRCAPGCSSAADCPSLANAMPACSGGVCILGSCLAGFGDCDGLSADGCEVSTRARSTAAPAGTRARSCTRAPRARPENAPS